MLRMGQTAAPAHEEPEQSGNKRLTGSPLPAAAYPIRRSVGRRTTILILYYSYCSATILTKFLRIGRNRRACSNAIATARATAWARTCGRSRASRPHPSPATLPD